VGGPTGSVIQGCKGGFEAHCILDEKSRNDLLWWKKNVHSLKNWTLPQISVEIHTDASLKGWDAVLGIKKTGGAWSRFMVT